jgi:hypothetical protein
VFRIILRSFSEVALSKALLVIRGKREFETSDGILMVKLS